MLTLLKLLIAGFIGLGLGLAATYLALRRQFSPERVKLGIWTTIPQIGTNEIDPYARARIAWSGEVPLGQGEGWTLTARHDNQNRPLKANCTYWLSGTMPVSRFWTITVSKSNGDLIDNQTHRPSLTSGEVVYGEDGAAPILLSHDVQPGNWLQLPDSGSFMLTLRLYDSSFSPLAGNLIDDTQLPSLARLSCP
ncbi:MAG: DUF1214 domain-containing protein [Hyphomicrobiales bacterium]|nr:DUF1214 domain-containing protein [Hyphomicrobiales bacterium]MDE2115185.1 DUF1214 domain-containing protein [Hyphomicrobiales bacterium]